MPASTTSGGGKKFLKFAVDDDQKSETYRQAFFHNYEKVNGHWQTVDKHNKYEGQLIHYEYKDFVHQNKTIEQLLLHFDDGNGGVEVVQMNFNFTTRALMNSLMNDPDYVANRPITIRTYISGEYGSLIVHKEEGDSKEHWIGWKFDWDNQAKPKKIQAGNQTVVDDTECNQWWKQWFDSQFKGRLKGVPSSSESTQQPEQQPAQQEPQSGGAPTPPPTAGQGGAPTPPSAQYPAPGNNQKSNPNPPLPGPPTDDEDDDLPF